MKYNYDFGDTVKVRFDGDGKADGHGLINDFSKDDIFKIFDRRMIGDGGLSFATYYGEGGGKSGWCPEWQLVLVGDATSWKGIDERFELMEAQQKEIKEVLDMIEIQMKEHKKKFPGS